MATVALIGTFDTKGAEYAWLAEKVADHGAQTLTIDVGPYSNADVDITARQIAEAAGQDLTDILKADDRGAAMTAMADGVAHVVTSLLAEGKINAVLAVGGSGGSSVAASGMRALPVGVPKLLVSTMAAGDVSPYVGETDTTMMYSVVDVAGINYISEQVFGNAAAAAAAMAIEHERRLASPTAHERPLVGLTMFGLTTPVVDEAREELWDLGYEPLVFHATGAGGSALEKLAKDRQLAGVLDLTTTELADDLVGGILTAGPHRLEATGEAGLPQVVSVGAIDMINFGPEASVPDHFEGRNFLVHNPTITLMRTTVEENAELGRRIGEKLRRATGPVTLMLPLRGISGIDIEGGPFRDEAADEALFNALRTTLEGSDVVIHELDTHINDAGFGREAARALHQYITG